MLLLNPVILVSVNSWAGTDMHSSQEDCHTENYCQGFTPRKHPREEVEPEEDISPKRQQTTVKFGEASLVRYWIFISFL